MDWARILGKGRPAAWLAALAIVVQALMVAPAAHAGSTIEICTAHGREVVQLDAKGVPVKPDHKSAAHCGLCVLAAPIESQTTRIAVPVRQTVRIVHDVIATDAPPPSARGPPRPFGQAPPIASNA